MLYQIDARLSNGKPRLCILDSSGDCLRLVWQPGSGDRSNEIQDFFRELFLITAMDELAERSHHP